MRYQVVLNPHAGRGRGRRMVQPVEEHLQRAGLDYRLWVTEGPGHATELARTSRADGFDAVVAVGGDGTVSEVVNGLAQGAQEAQPIGPLGIVPLGTGNDLAAMAGIPGRWDQAIRSLGRAGIRPVDLGRVEVHSEAGRELRYFDNNLGCGFEAQVTLTSRRLQHLRGPLVYVAGVLLTLIDYRQPRVTVAWQGPDDTTTTLTKPVLMLSVGNGRRNGGMYYVTPHAEIDDGLLDLGIADALPRWRILSLLPRVFYGGHIHDPAFTLVRTGQISISSPDWLPVHADGELICADAYSLTISIQPRRLQLLTP